MQIYTRSIPATCDALGIRRSKCYQLINRGFLVAKKIDGRTVVTDASIQAFVETLPPANIKRIKPAA